MKEKIVDYGTEHPVKVLSASKEIIACHATDINEGFMLIGNHIDKIPESGDEGKIIFERDKWHGHWQYYPIKSN